MVGVIDYDAGNVKSVMKAVERLGGNPVLTSDVKVLDGCSSLILPGVGSFGKAVQNLKAGELDRYIKKAVSEGRLLLGICLGMQMLFDRSYEDGECDGLGLIGGEVVRFGKENDASWDESNKIPHMGWNSMHLQNNGRLFKDIPEDSYVYFVHSYYLKAADEGIVTATTEYSTHIHASVEQGNVFACQFHPEKSSDIGIQILKNFVEL